MIYIANKQNEAWGRRRRTFRSSFFFILLNQSNSCGVNFFPPPMCVCVCTIKELAYNKRVERKSSGKLIIVRWELLNWLAANGGDVKTERWEKEEGKSYFQR